jgi:hypothetical protein
MLACKGVSMADDNWTVHSREDCYHEPEFPGDLATFVTIWRAELNHVQVRSGYFTCDDCEEFDTEGEARAYCDRMNASDGVRVDGITSNG